MASSSKSSRTPPRTSSRRSSANARAPAAASSVDPLDDAEFAGLIAALAPFERAPWLAVGVSGGPDSLALCLLADRWARARGGEVLGLTVDHGLRPESAAEAAATGAWLRARGIAHEILPWRGPKPTSGIQAAARRARHDLLADRCRGGAILHLLLAHHQDDQIETVAFRERRGSGPDGLAGMPAIREVPGLRLLRPLLAVAKARLLATLERLGQPWLEDPSNRARRFARARLREEALDGLRLERLAAEQAGRRTALDLETACWLVQHARIDPAGFVLLSQPALRAAPAEVARRALTQALAAVGGGDYPPRSERLGRLLGELRSAVPAAGRTLAGCRIQGFGDRILICREAGAIHGSATLHPGRAVLWDGRFLALLSGDGAGIELRALGEAGLRELRAASPTGPVRRLPPPVRAALPCFWIGERPVGAPHLGLAIPEVAAGISINLRFCPAHPLAGPRFGAQPDMAGNDRAATPLLRNGETLC
jgi:tRNA(Ile)-lysidine synthase